MQSDGREAEDFLQRICANNIVPYDDILGSVVHTGMLNSNGGFENDCSIARLDTNKSDQRSLTLIHRPRRDVSPLLLLQVLPDWSHSTADEK